MKISIIPKRYLGSSLRLRTLHQRAKERKVRKISSMKVSSRYKEYRKSYETNLRNQGKSLPEAPSASNEFQTASKDIPSSQGKMSAKGFSLAGG